ncbi:MAG: 2-oxo-4-hydroxy-4-carboxy-5-ureidoimidazoline decarboxylase [Hyphomicrobiales bacterium]|nr:2-oxo-4-hydroxy-4-carboxy-5-ureidoimidazoline decarboxylase [Hyphomicrobiales bacterium]
MRSTLSDLNAASDDEFLARTEFLVENSPWVMERIVNERPFASVDALCSAIETTVQRAGRELQLKLIRAHPELAGMEAASRTMTVDSTHEQKRLGLLSLSKDAYEELSQLNAEYRRKFAFPCVIALSRHASLESVLKTFRARLDNTPQVELQHCIEDMMHVIRNRASRF